MHAQMAYNTTNPLLTRVYPPFMNCFTYRITNQSQRHPCLTWESRLGDWL